MRKRAYRASALKNVNLSATIERLAEGLVWVGMDIAKREAVVVLRDSNGYFERPWKVKLPGEIQRFVELLLELREHRSVIPAMEPTGTYGDALRQALQDAGFVVRRVSGKMAKDYSEIFDGVPSTHDGKAAAVIAELTAIDKSSPWPMRPISEWKGKVDRQVCWLDTQESIYLLWIGRIEGMLSRHWPEATTVLQLTAYSLLKALEHYGGPSALAKDPDAADQLKRWSRGYLKAKKIKRLIGSARHTVGVRMSNEQVKMLQQFAEEALRAYRETQRARRELKALCEQNKVTQVMATVVGAVTACVLFSVLGDPRDYHCGQAYRKAMGLNLKERSSGRHRGKLKITKRGSGLARRWLFFAAMRVIQHPAVAEWYQRKKHKDQDRGLPAVVAVMRKLALALYATVVRGATYDPARLFPGRRPRSGARRAAAVASGALPPNPRDLSQACQVREGQETADRRVDDPPAASNSAPGSALGSVPTVALSSDRDSQI